MNKPSKLLQKDKELREKDEPSPPNATRKGVWRILAISTVLAIIVLAIVWIVAV